LIKVAHLADIHYRSLSRHEEYRSSFEDAFAKLRVLKPDIILIAGDIVHSKTQGISPEVITQLTWWFNGLADIAKVHITLGNHDGLILNPDREDAISPIVAAINRPELILHKKSGVYPLDDQHNLCVFSCFDEKGWSNVKPESGKINIATFHGPVIGLKADEPWAAECQVNIDVFKDFDYGMFGDIHKHQFLTPRIAYAGSTIAQNYGEGTGKGFLFWLIDGKEFRTKHIEIAHEFPFVTLSYDGDIDALQSQMEAQKSQAHVRVRIDENVTQAERSQVRAAIKDVSNPTEIVFKTDVDETSVQISDDTLDETTKIDSFESIDSLVGEYYSKAKFPQPVYDDMSKILSKVWNSGNMSNRVNSGRWAVKKLEFDNIFGYGLDNIVNFESASGITGIFGKNRSGKSSLCGALTYTLFNGTDRGAMKNIHIVNARKNFCKSRMIISKKGQNYLIERQTVKKTTNAGSSHATTHLNIFECDDEGHTTKDLTSEQRRLTEKTLRSHVGILEDFLLTSLASQGDINRFVSQGSSARKSILAKFLRLDVLDKLYDQIKIELLVSKAALKKIPEKQFDVQAVDRLTKLRARKAERDDETHAIEKITSVLHEINQFLEVQTDEMYVQSEIDDQAEKVRNVVAELQDLTNKKSELLIQKSALLSSLEDIQSDVADVDFEDIRKTKEEIIETERELLVVTGEVETKVAEIKTDKKAVKKLSDVPCADAFPTCKYIKGAQKAKKSMLKKQDVLAQSRRHASVLRSTVKKLMKKKVDEKLEQKQSYDEKRFTLSQELSQCEMSILGNESQTTNIEREISEAKSLLSRMRINVCSDESAKEREILIKKKKIADEKLQEAKIRVQNLSERIGLLISEIDRLRLDKENFEKNNHAVYVLNLLQRALSKNGIPLQIVKKKLPAINREIAIILQGITGFTVELSIDSDSGMDIILNYGDSKRVIECCSGMEKMMASLAIRTALIRVSSLPKCDMLIIDEGFGALDATNVEACTALLRSLTKTFRLILIISHVDTVKDVVDNIIEISKNKGHDSQVKFL